MWAARSRCLHRISRLLPLRVVKPWPDQLENPLACAGAANGPHELRQSAPRVLQHVWTSNRADTADRRMEPYEHGRHTAVDRGLRDAGLESTVLGPATLVAAGGGRPVAPEQPSRPGELVFGRHIRNRHDGEGSLRCVEGRRKFATFRFAHPGTQATGHRVDTRTVGDTPVVEIAASRASDAAVTAASCLEPMKHRWRKATALGCLQLQSPSMAQSAQDHGALGIEEPGSPSSFRSVHTADIGRRLRRPAGRAGFEPAKGSTPLPH